MSNILNLYLKKKSKNTVHFLDTVTVYETYSCEEYDRTNTDIQCLEIQTDTTLLENWWTRLLKNIGYI
jgi:hypothetical protein